MSADVKDVGTPAAPGRGTDWQGLDLGRAPSGFAGVSGPLALTSSIRLPPMATPHGSGILVATARAGMIGVPVGAFVSVGSGKRGRRSGGRFGRRGIANDNLARKEPRSVWRDMFFLAVLAATVAGAFWSGRNHGEQRVIVVPGPSSSLSVIT